MFLLFYHRLSTTSLVRVRSEKKHLSRSSSVQSVSVDSLWFRLVRWFSWFSGFSRFSWFRKFRWFPVVPTSQLVRWFSGSSWFRGFGSVDSLVPLVLLIPLVLSVLVNVPCDSASAKPDCRSVDSEAKCVVQSLIYCVVSTLIIVPKVLTVR